MQLEPELNKERDGVGEVVDDYAHVVHALDCHVLDGSWHATEKQSTLGEHCLMPNKSVESAAVHGSGGRARRRAVFRVDIEPGGRNVRSRVPQKWRDSQLLRGSYLCALALVAAIALLLVPAGANAASPVLEFVVPGDSLPVSFTTESGAVNAEMAGFKSLVHCTASHGEGEITGPRTTVSKYRLTGCVTERGSQQKCKSAGASEEEIVTGAIEADLVFIDQAQHQAGVLLNPKGGTYISFECGGEPAEGQGPFLAPVGPINREATSFTATLSQFESVQTPDEYENENGERLRAIPTGRVGSNEFVPTGVEAAFTVETSVPVEIKAITAQEIEAKQQEETLNKLLNQLHQEEAANKKHEEEAIALSAAAKTHQEEESRAKSKVPTRAQLLARALRKCEKQPKKRRARCVASAHKKYGSKAGRRGRHKKSP